MKDIKKYLKKLKSIKIKILNIIKYNNINYKQPN